MPASCNAAVVAASSSAIRDFGGSAHAGCGIRSILRRFSRVEISPVASPRAASAATVAAAARSSASSSPGRVSRRCSSTGPSRVISHVSEPRFESM